MGIICDLILGSIAIQFRDHLRSNLESFVVQDHLGSVLSNADMNT